MALYMGVEFAKTDDNDTTEIGLISSNWLTPRKQATYWPPFKSQLKLDNALKQRILPNESWGRFSILRCFFETDDLTKGQKKIKQAENTSDIQSDLESQSDGPIAKRRSIRPKRLCSESDEENEPKTKYQYRDRDRCPPRVTVQINSQTSPPRSQDSQFSDLQVTNLSTAITPRSSCLNNNLRAPSASPLPFNSRLNTPISCHSHTEHSNSDLNNIVTTLLHIKEQNNQILSWIKSQGSQSAPSSYELPNDLPITFPIARQVDVAVIEEYLQNDKNLTNLVLYFSTLGGRDVSSKTNNILRNIFGDSVAKNYSFYGTRSQKQPFHDKHLKSVVVRAVQVSTPKVTSDEICGYIKTWLKHAPQREANTLRQRQNRDRHTL